MKTRKNKQFVLPLLLILLACNIFGQVDTIIVEEEQEWLLASSIPLCAHLAQPDYPFLITFSSKVKRQENRLLQNIVKDKALVLTTSAQRDYIDSLELPCEVLQLETDPTSAALSLALRFWQSSEEIIVVPLYDYEAMIQGAYLAGHLKIPLVPITVSNEENQVNISQALAKLKTKRLSLVVSKNIKIPHWMKFPGIVTKKLPIRNVEKRIVTHIGPSNIRNIILTRKSDKENWVSEAAWLAPYLGLRRQAPIVFTDTRDSRQTEQKIFDFIKAYELTPRSVTILADYRAIGVTLFYDEALLGEYEIEVEPCAAPFEYAYNLVVGRFPGTSLRDISMLIARNFQRERQNSSANVMVHANPIGEIGDLPLAEAISRATAAEFRNGRIKTKEFYRKTPDYLAMMHAAEKAHLIIFEGHSADQYLFKVQESSPKPAKKSIRKLQNQPLVILQSCSSLKEEIAQEIFDAGGIGLIGTVTSVHSASGSAFVKSFCDGLLYRNETLGEALRDAKNYFLCLALLKEKRGHSETAKARRVALSFRLWGDPELKLSNISSKEPKLARISAHFTEKNAICITTPAKLLPKINNKQYTLQVFPGTQYAGVVKRIKNKPKRRILPFYFFKLTVPEKYRKFNFATRKKSRHVLLPDAQNKNVYILYFPEDKPKKEENKQYHLKFYSGRQ